MREYLINTRSVADENGRTLTLYYCLITEEPEKDAEFESCGVRVKAVRDGVPECCDAPGISLREKDVLYLIELLSRNCVTPTSLPEVVDDWLGTS